MDIFQIDASTALSLNRTNGAATIIDENTSDHLPEVSFDAGPEFNLNFFDNPDDSNTQGGYSDPGSVESTIASSSPPPPPLPLNAHSNATSLPPPVNQFHANGQLTTNHSLNGHTNGSLCGKCMRVCLFGEERTTKNRNVVSASARKYITILVKEEVRGPRHRLLLPGIIPLKVFMIYKRNGTSARHKIEGAFARLWLDARSPLPLSPTGCHRKALPATDLFILFRF